MPDNNTDKPNVFISYCRDDLSFVEKLRDGFFENEIIPLVDLYDIKKSEDFWKEIENLIIKSDAVVFVLSPSFIKSSNCKKEIDFANSLNKKLIPIVCGDIEGDIVPDILSSLDYIYFIANSRVKATGNFEESLQELLEVLTVDKEWVSEHTRLGILANRWINFDEHDDLLLQGIQLDEAEKWSIQKPKNSSDLTELHLTFIQKSRAVSLVQLKNKQRQVKRTKRFQKYAFFGLAMTGFLLFVFLGFVLWKNQQTVKREAIVLSSLAQKSIDAEQYTRAMRIALKGLPSKSGLPWQYESRELEANLSGAALLSPFIAILKGHKHDLTSVAFSPNGKMIITTSKDQTSKIWDSQTKKIISVIKKPKKLQPNTGKTNKSLFSPNSKRILTIHDDNTIRIWNSKTGKRSHILKKCKIAFCARRRIPILNGKTATFSPDGKLILTTLNKVAQIWNSYTGELLGTLTGHVKKVNNAIFSPDGTYIVTISNDKTARLWDTKRRMYLSTFSGHTHTIYDIIFSPDSKLIATFSESGNVRVWNVKGRTWIFTLKGVKPDYRILRNRVSFSPDGSYLAVATNNMAILWNSYNGEFLAMLKGHKNRVQSVKFSPDGKQILTVSLDKTMKLWSVNSKGLPTPVETLKGHSEGIIDASYSPNSKYIVSASLDNTAIIWKPKLISLSKVIHEIHPNLQKIIYSVDTKKALLISLKNTAKLWDVRSGKVISSLQGRDDIVDVIFNSSGTRIISKHKNNTSVLWSSKNGRKIINLDIKDKIIFLKDFKNKINFAKFSPNGKLAVSSLKNNIIGIWNAETGRFIISLKGHSKYITDIKFSLNSNDIITTSLDGTARLWNTKTGKLLSLFQHKSGVIKVSLSPNGLQIFTVSDRKTRLWDIKTKKIVLTLGVPAIGFTKDGDNIFSYSKIWNINSKKILASFIRYDENHENTGWTQISIIKDRFKFGTIISPNREHIVTDSVDHTVQLWNAQTGGKISILNSHKRRVRSVAFSSDSKRLATASEDHEIRLWDTETGALIVTLKGHDSAVNTIVFSPDGRSITTSSEDRTMRLWDISWATQWYGKTLQNKVCKEKLLGIETFTTEDTTDPILRGFEGENVCTQHGILSKVFWIKKIKSAPQYLRYFY